MVSQLWGQIIRFWTRVVMDGIEIRKNQNDF